MFSRFQRVVLMASLALVSTVNAQTASLPEGSVDSSQVASLDFEPAEFQPTSMCGCIAPTHQISQNSGRSIAVRGGWNWLGNVEDSPSDFFTPVIGLRRDSPFVDGNSVGYAISVGLNKELNSRLRTETEFAFRSNQTAISIPSFLRTELDAELTAFSILQNAYVDFDNRTRFTPYAGAGIGISFVRMESGVTTFSDNGTTLGEEETSENDTAFTYQFIGGISTEITRRSELFVEYRLLATTEVDLDSFRPFTAPYRANNLFLGMRINY